MPFRSTAALLASTVLTLTAVAAAPVASSAAPSHDSGEQIYRAQRFPSILSPTYATNTLGEAYAAWIEGGGDRRTLYAAYQGSSGRWGKPVRIAGPFTWSGGFATAGEPDMAIDNRGRALLAWSQPQGRDLRIRAVTATHGRWGNPRYISPRNDVAAYPSVSVSDNGKYAVAQWTGNYVGSIQLATVMTAFRGTSGRWKPADRLNPEDPVFRLNVRPSTPVIDNRGVVTTAWYETEFAAPVQFGRALLSTRGPRTGWSTGVLYQGGPGNYVDNAPVLATTADGKLLAAVEVVGSVWTRQRAADGTWAAPQTAIAPPAGVFTQAGAAGVLPDGRGVIQLRTLDTTATPDLEQTSLLVQDPAGAWHQEPVSPPHAAEGIGTVFVQDFEVGPRGDVAVTWDLVRANLDRWAPAFVRHRLPDGRWRSPVRIGRVASDLVLGLDGRGRVGVVWAEGSRYQGQDRCCRSVRGTRVK